MSLKRGNDSSLSWLFPSSWSFTNQGLEGRGESDIVHSEGLLLQGTPDTEGHWHRMCQSSWEVGKNLAIWLVYHLPNTLARALLPLVESGHWSTLGFWSQGNSISMLLTKVVVSTIAALRHSQYLTVPTHWVGHALDFIFVAKVKMD